VRLRTRSDAPTRLPNVLNADHRTVDHRRSQVGAIDAASVFDGFVYIGVRLGPRVTRPTRCSMSRATSSSATVPALSPSTECRNQRCTERIDLSPVFDGGLPAGGARKQRFWPNSAATETRSWWPSPPGWPCGASPRTARADARLLDAVRRKDLVAATVDATLRTELAEINGPLRTGVAALARRLYGRVTKETIA
jgi:hypothetical protein